MTGKAMLERFVEANPLAVMSRAIIGGMLNEEAFDRVFDENRSRQYHQSIRFSSLAVSMADIAVGAVKNRNQAYRKHRDEVRASAEAYYTKLNRTEPAVSEAVVDYSAEKATQWLQQLGFEPWEVLPGYHVFSLDGNHLQKTEKRLKETRGLCAAPLPGTIVARFNHQTSLFDRAYLIEDAHAQEATVLNRVLEDWAEHDLVIADRHFCVVAFLAGIAARKGCFVIRQHGRLQGELLGKRRHIGRTSTGTAYEQSMRICQKDCDLVVRRITIELDQPTRDGDTEIHILSNLPAEDADGCQISEMYRQRWEIENAFYILTTTLVCEMKSNCHPRCALFLFCMAMLAYNCRQVLLAALYSEHAEEDVNQMSHYQMSIDTVCPMGGLLIAISDDEWERLVPSSPREQVSFLRSVSRHVDVRDYRKSVRGPKMKKPKRKRCKAGTHVSAAKLLSQRK